MIDTGDTMLLCTSVDGLVSLIWVVFEDDDVDSFVRAICDAARTGQQGKVGGGKVFVSPVGQALRIRTGDTGSCALDDAGIHTHG
ncbi:P-II family nitrogen regulator [Atopobiaceae bacterium 24-176]